MPNLLFIYLKAFSFTGGIEKVNRVLLRALYDFEVEDSRYTVSAASPYDTQTDERYFPQNRLKDFGASRFRFMLGMLLGNYKPDMLIVGHVNLAPAAWILKLRNPEMKMVVITHGIEVWSPLKGLYLWLLRRADKIISVSSYTQNVLINLFNLSPEKIDIVPNCLDIFFAPPNTFEKPTYLLERYKLKPEQKTLLTVSRLNSTESYKGYDKVLQLLPELSKQFPNIHYILAGKGDTSELTRINTLIAQLGIQQHVTLTGFVPDEELSDHYKLANTFVMPSTKEGFGIVFIEAMACGTPALGGNVDGSPEALGHSSQGYMANPDNSSELAAAITQALNAVYDPAALQQETLERFSFTAYKKRLGAVLFTSPPAALT